MLRRTLKFLRGLQQDFKRVSDHFETLCMKAIHKICERTGFP